jgi:hypothetical protein
MRQHEAIFLEEPPTPEFEQMLAGNTSIDAYVAASDTEYPQFTREMCGLLRELRARDKKIYQVEPYLENLLALHEFFADGHSPDDVKRDSLARVVYLAEKKATGALLAYYQAATSGAFEKTLTSVKRFARTDAARFRLRDELRSQALAVSLSRHTTSFVETGVMHYAIGRFLRRQIPRTLRINSVFLADEVLRERGLKGHLYGPGDRLTLLYICHPNIADTLDQTRLAARALIYAKIIIKEESPGGTLRFAHLEDELLCIEATRGLTIDDCRELYGKTRRVGTYDARQIVAEYLMAARPHLGRKLRTRLTAPPSS